MWTQFFNLIPTEILKLICAGPPATQYYGWAACQLQSEPSLEAPPDIGDVYYIIPPTKNKPIRLAFFQSNDFVLSFTSLDTPEWGDWQNSILPDLRPLSVYLATL